MNKRTSILLGVLLLLLSGTALAVLPPRVSWNPAELKPASIAPGNTASFQVTLTHTGRLPIPATNQLKILPSAELLPYVTVIPPSFPPVMKKGSSVKVKINVSVPQGTPLGVVKGNLTLSRVLPNGKVKEVWRADALAVELTFSAIPLPPDPGVAGKATVEGVITNRYKIRDEVLRAIVFAYPTSEPIRNAFIQYSQADQKMAEDYLALQNDPVEQKRVVRLDAKEVSAGHACMWHVFGADTGTLEEQLQAIDASSDARHAIDIIFLNTKERSRIYNKADALLGGTSERVPKPNEMAALCDANLLD